MTKRPTLAELATESTGDVWTCRRCGCRMWAVVNTYILKSGHIRRIRACRNCHEVLRTVEEPKNKLNGN